MTQFALIRAILFEKSLAEDWRKSILSCFHAQGGIIKEAYLRHDSD